MDPNLKLRKTPQDFVVPASTFDYQSAVGGLLYLALTARPDVVVVHLSDHNRVMVAQVDYYIRANHSINGKGKLR